MVHEEFLNAALRSEFYRQKLKNTPFYSWDSLPFTEKSELRDAEPFSLLGTTMSHVASYHETSGTTGKPTPSWYSYEDIEKEAQLVVESDLQLSSQDFLLNRLTFTVAVASLIGLWAAQYAHSGHVSMAKSGISTPTRVLDVMERTDPTILMEIPFEMEILHGVHRILHRPRPKALRALLLAGELLSPARKRWIEKIWGVPVYGLFGSTETGGLFMTCRNGHYHLDNPNVLIEVLDEYSQPVPFGQLGDLVVSTLRQGMPVLRFANHDRVMLQPADYCGCGNTAPVLLHYGRAEDRLVIGGKQWSSYDIQEIIYSSPEVPMLWQLQSGQERTGEDSVTFLYQSYDGAHHSETDSLLRDTLESKFEVPVKVHSEALIPEETLLKPSAVTKFKYFV